MAKWPTIAPMKRNLADKSIWLNVLSRYLSIALFIASFFWWPMVLAFYVATQVWRGRRQLFSFSGRLGRRAFWASICILFLWAVVGGALVVGIVEAALPDKDARTLPGTLWLAAALIPTVIAPVALSAVATGTRRLHDCDKPGMWLLALYGVPAAGIGMYVVPIFSDTIRSLLLVLVVFPVSVWACVALVFQRGTVGTNRFGADLAIAPGKAEKSAATST